MTPNLSIQSKYTVGKRIAANTGLMMGSKIAGAVIGVGSLWLAARTLSVGEFGVILFLHAYMLFFSEVTTFKTWQSIIRFGTDDVKNEDVDGLSKLLKFAFKLDAITAIISFLLAVGTFGLIVKLVTAFPDVFGRGGDGLDIVLLGKYALLYCILLLFRQRSASVGIFRLFDKFNILAVQSVVQPIVRFTGVVIASLTGAGFEGFLLAWFMGSLADYLFLPIAAYIELKGRNLVRPIIRAKASLRRPRKGLWPFMIKANIDSTLAAANLHLPVLLVMAVFGSAWVAVFRIAEEIAKLLSEGFKLLDQVIYPELAKMVSDGKVEKIWRLVTRTAVILLSFGLGISVLVMIVGPIILGKTFSEEYALAAPLTSLLVPAAALLGTAAPLYPVLYAANHPERAIYARGTGVLIYIISFFILSFTIGKMAPGWAAILGNFAAVIFLVFLTKQTLKKKTKQQTEASKDISEEATPIFKLIGESPAKLWGLPIAEWQRRAAKKAGVLSDPNKPSTVHLAVQWVLSSRLGLAFLKTDKTALIANDQIIGVTGVDESDARGLIGQSAEAATRSGLRAVGPEDLVDPYNKALRKMEPPYALNIEATPVVDIMQRQYKSSYKGITDFVTKWFWPVPAFYVTRLCAALRLTPNMVTTIGFVLMLMALYYFWHGQWALGFITGWMMTFLDTVDGKLARTTMTYSWWGNIYDHGIDLIHPPFWYYAWFIGLGFKFDLSHPATWAICAILIGYVVDRVIEGIFMRQHGFHIHVWTKFNSGLRFFIARRNPNMFIFMLGIIASIFIPGAGKAALYIIAIWTWVCIMANFVSLIAGMVAKCKRPLKSWMDATA